jgi:hypothetical protein
MLSCAEPEEIFLPCPCRACRLRVPHEEGRLQGNVNERLASLLCHALMTLRAMSTAVCSSKSGTSIRCMKSSRGQCNRLGCCQDARNVR